MEFLNPLEAMIKADDIVRDLRQVEQMTFDQVAALAANFSITPKTGVFSTGTVNLFFSGPQDVVIVVGQGFTAANGTRYFATQAVSVTRAQLSAQFDPVQGAYRLDIPAVQSSGSGPDFSIKAGNMVAIDGQTVNIALVTNLADFTASVAAETKRQLASRIINSASMRNFCSADSTEAAVGDDPRVAAVSVIGAGDSEMIRDILFGGLHTLGMQDCYVYGSEPLIDFVADQPLPLDFLPTFIFFGHDLTAAGYDPLVPIGPNAGVIVAVRKVEFGTGSGSGFLPFGTMAPGEDYVDEFFGPGSPATKNSPDEVWRLRVIKRPPAPATTIRVTAYRINLPATLQIELVTNGKRAPTQGCLFKAFTVALLDVVATVKPLPGASSDPLTYVNAIKDLIARTPIAGTIDQSDIVNALVVAGADEVVLPISTTATIFYPDLATSTVVLGNEIGGPSIERESFSARTIGFYPNNISISIL
jgi:hypothetical protein